MEEYGWRISFLIAAAFSLQNVILGALVFPLPSSTQESPKTQSVEELNMMEPENPNKMKPIFSAKNLLDR